MTSRPKDGRESGFKKTKVIVITDIGNDIDDTLALLLLLGASDAVEILAIVTSVNDGVERGRVARGYLRVLGVSDASVEILPSVDNFKKSGCYVPEDFPSAEDSRMGKVEDTPQRILDICRENINEDIVFLGIAGLTPLAQAIELDDRKKSVFHKCIKHVYLQGNVVLEEKGRRRRPRRKVKFVLQPHPAAYNFQCDMEAAKQVFSYFQGFCPITTLGKFAAYQIGITKGDFDKWTQQLKQAWMNTTEGGELDYEVPSAPNLLKAAKSQMQHFCSTNRIKFESIYKMPKDAEEDFSWFDRLPPTYICSRPYDPFLALILVEDARGKSLDGKLLKPTEVRTDVGVHRLYGNTTENHSVLSPKQVHKYLVEAVSRAML